MGRRLAGGALAALGLVAASLAWVGFAAGRTVLDPSRSQVIADGLYSDREVRDQLRSSLASGLEAALPEGVRVSRSELLAAADRALDDPAVQQLLVGGLVRAHQRLLGDDPRSDEPIVLDGAALAQAGRTALVSLRPDLVSAIPVPPSLPVTLPTDRLPSAGGLRTWLAGAVALLAAAAVGLVVAAFVVTNDRPRVLRRVGFWALGASAFWLLIGVVLPELARLLLPGQAAILAALWGVAAGAMLEPSRLMALCGVAALALSGLWWVAASLTGRGVEDRGRAGGPAGAAVGAARPGVAASWPGRGVAAPARPVVPPSSQGPPTPPRGTPVISPMPRAAPRWVEGVGYVDDPDPTSPAL